MRTLAGSGMPCGVVRGVAGRAAPLAGGVGALFEVAFDHVAQEIARAWCGVFVGGGSHSFILGGRPVALPLATFFTAAVHRLCTCARSIHTWAVNIRPNRRSNHEPHIVPPSSNGLPPAPWPPARLFAAASASAGASAGRSASTCRAWRSASARRAYYAPPPVYYAPAPVYYPPAAGLLPPGAGVLRAAAGVLPPGARLLRPGPGLLPPPRSRLLALSADGHSIRLLSPDKSRLRQGPAFFMGAARSHIARNRWA